MTKAAAAAIVATTAAVPSEGRGEGRMRTAMGGTSKGINPVGDVGGRKTLTMTDFRNGVVEGLRLTKRQRVVSGKRKTDLLLTLLLRAVRTLQGGSMFMGPGGRRTWRRMRNHPPLGKNMFQFLCWRQRKDEGIGRTGMGGSWKGVSRSGRQT